MLRKNRKRKEKDQFVGVAKKVLFVKNELEGDDAVFNCTYGDNGADDLRGEGQGEGSFLLQPEKHVEQVLVLNIVTCDGSGSTPLRHALLDDAGGDALGPGVAPPQITRGAAQPTRQP